MKVFHSVSASSAPSADSASSRSALRALQCLLLLAALISSSARAQEGSAHIVNGTLTSSFPGTGALLLFTDTTQTELAGLCSATLVGCRTVVTAAHCVCSGAETAADCTRSGSVPPARLRVFFQQTGFADVADVIISPDYDFGEGGDLAVVHLVQAVTGLDPSPLNQVGKPAVGTGGTIVGFGRSINDSIVRSDAGIKRQGTVTVAGCNGVVPNRTHVCWQFLGAESSTCSGDSGGPLFVDFGHGLALAGVTSGGINGTCEAPDRSFETDVFVYADWIAAHIDDCTTSARSSSDLRLLLSADGELSRESVEAHYEVVAPSDTSVLRATLNGEIAGVDFDLYVGANGPPSPERYDCADLAPSSFSVCELASASASTWHVLVRRAFGRGTYQLNVTALVDTLLEPRCNGDCDGDGVVSIENLVSGVNIILEQATAATCADLDGNGDGTVTVAELVLAVGNALGGCAS